MVCSTVYVFFRQNLTFVANYLFFTLAPMPELPEIPPGSRVVNGSSTGKPFPYQLQIRRNDRHHCGAVLISPRFALSAHHCFEPRKGKLVPKTSLSLVAGAYTSWDLDEIGQVRTIKDIKQLHHTNGQAQKWIDPDIVIIEVHEPFEMTPFVRPACLPTRRTLPGETCIVSGWGNIENEEKSAWIRDLNLQATKLDVVPSDDVSFCKKIYINFNQKYGSSGFYVGEHTLCAYDSHSSSCHGDSGGPLVCGTSGGATIHGIVSFGNPKCEYKHEDNEYDEFDPYPNVYVDVYHFIHEIKSFIVSI